MTITVKRLNFIEIFRLQHTGHRVILTKTADTSTKMVYLSSRPSKAKFLRKYELLRTVQCSRVRICLIRFCGSMVYKTRVV